MTSYDKLPKDELRNLYDRCKNEFEGYKELGLKLDMSRGKPGADQLDLVMGMMNVLGPDDYLAEDGSDCRNYGGLDGIPEMKRIFAELMEVRQDEVLVGGNASLTLMYESIIAFLTGPKDTAGARTRRLKFLCPAPGYDRHFTISEYLGFELVSIPMMSDGPDMEEIRRQVKDPAVAGIWCVPVFSNPQGIVYSERVIREMAALKPAAKDFRIFWDNAYIVHSFEGEPPRILNILRECELQGNYDMALVFSSFSKISFAGAGVCAMAASPQNLKRMREHLIVQSIGPDKINQLRHVRYFKNADGIRLHMKEVAKLLRPKFQAVLDGLETGLAGKGIGNWLKPGGGYFVSFDTMPGCAGRVVALCAEAGVVMTPAGAAYPYGQDPQDKNIRIAPTFPSLEQLKQAIKVFCAAVELAALEKLLGLH